MNSDAAFIKRSLALLDGLYNMVNENVASQSVLQKMKTLGQLLCAELTGIPVVEFPNPPENTFKDDNSEAIYFPSDDQQLDAVRNAQNSRFNNARCVPIFYVFWSKLFILSIIISLRMNSTLVLTL